MEGDSFSNPTNNNEDLEQDMLPEAEGEQQEFEGEGEHDNEGEVEEAAQTHTSSSQKVSNYLYITHEVYV